MQEHPFSWVLFSFYTFIYMIIYSCGKDDYPIGTASQFPPQSSITSLYPACFNACSASMRPLLMRSG